MMVQLEKVSAPEALSPRLGSPPALEQDSSLHIKTMPWEVDDA